MSKKGFAIISLSIIPLLLSAQADSIYRPISASCVPGISSNGFPGTNVATNFSFNVLGGINAGVVGFELGSLLNINAKDMIGLQISGITNFTGGNVSGVQIAGVNNFVIGDVNVTHLAGVFNVALGKVNGAQLAGVFNIAGGQVKGAQLAGVFNLAVGGVLGAQLAGPLNISIGDAPVQLGVTNIETGQTFTQLGVANIAVKSRGLQLGVFNFAAEQEGVPIGIVSVAGDGWYHLNLWADETAPVSVGFKMGSKYIYNIYTYGYNPLGDTKHSRFGLGLGTRIPFDPFYVDVDAIAYQMNEGISPWGNINGYNGLSQLRIMAGLSILPGLRIFAGPTLNVWNSTEFDGETIPSFGLFLGDFDSQDFYTDIWLGFSLGVEVF